MWTTEKKNYNEKKKKKMSVNKDIVLFKVQKQHN